MFDLPAGGHQDHRADAAGDRLRRQEVGGQPGLRSEHTSGGGVHGGWPG